MRTQRIQNPSSVGSNPTVAIPHGDWETGISCDTHHLSRSPRRSPRSPAERLADDPIGSTLLAAAVALILLLGLAFRADEAQAHVVTIPQCRAYAAVHGLVTGQRDADAFRRDLRRCIAAAIQHTADHQIAISAQACINVPGSNMSRTSCRALASAAFEIDRAAWAADPAMHELLRRESTWSPNAVNDKSGACGLFQRLPCPWPSSTSPDWVGATPLVQARNGVRYIRDRDGYGSPARALDFHDANGWY